MSDSPYISLQNAMHDSCKLLASYEKNVRKVRKNDPDITKFFLIKSGQNLELIGKYSFKGIYVIVVDVIFKCVFGQRYEKLNIEKNLAVALKVISRASQADSQRFDLIHLRCHEMRYGAFAPACMMNVRKRLAARRQ